MQSHRSESELGLKNKTKINPIHKLNNLFHQISIDVWYIICYLYKYFNYKF